jgi:hypothetical protein
VKLRGWYYPAIGDKIEQFFFGENYVAGLVEFSNYTEAWRFYQSGQFVHYFAFWEDYEKGIQWRIGFRTDYDPSMPLKVKGIVMTLYTVAEIFKLASNFVKEGIFDDKIHILMKLHDTQGRSLATDPMRILYKDYKCMVDEITFEKIYDVTTFDKNLELNIVDAVKEIFHSFNWVSQDIEKAITPDLKDFLKGKYAM